MKGLFITFEGSECCGKSTQSKLLYRHLVKMGYSVVFLREPGGTKISEQIRRMLLDPNNKIMGPGTELLLYMASRSQTVEEVIKPVAEVAAEGEAKAEGEGGEAKEPPAEKPAK